MKPEWKVEDLGDGTYDVFKDNRIVAYDQDLSAAVGLVRQGGGDSYVLVEEDGYRTTHRA